MHIQLSEVFVLDDRYPLQPQGAIDLRTSPRASEAEERPFQEAALQSGWACMLCHAPCRCVVRTALRSTLSDVGCARTSAAPHSPKVHPYFVGSWPQPALGLVAR